ncbi:MAG: hypothetical protein GF313_04125 [Caldithrix sp.]|nr:hypothetical protein [Caldithrix sp.]
MINRFEQFFRNLLSPDQQKDANNETGDEPSLEHQLHIATTAIFLEMAYTDSNVDDRELDHIKATIQSFFNLPHHEIDELIKMANEKRKAGHDIWSFTTILKQYFSRNERKKIIEDLWRLVYADEVVNKYEERLIRQVSTLLGLEHSELIEAKINASK